MQLTEMNLFIKYIFYGFIQFNFKCRSHEAPIAFFKKVDLFIVRINFTVSSHSKYVQDAVLNKNMECPQKFMLALK